MILIKEPRLTTKLEVFTPRYKNKHQAGGEMEALLHMRKVHQATSIIIVEFTKAKHLQGQRFAITRDTVQKCPIGSNRKDGIKNMYIVPMSLFDNWRSYEEEHNIAIYIFDDVEEKRTKHEQIKLL